MIQVTVNKDIREIEPKIIGPFTTRQLICCLLGAAIGIPVGLLVPGEIMAKIMIGGCCAAPFLLAGWLKIFELPLEKAVPMMLKTYIYPQKRKYICVAGMRELEEHKTIDKVKKSKRMKGYL